jgi:hypothetical protein
LSKYQFDTITENIGNKMKEISYPKKMIENIFYVSDRGCETPVRKRTFVDTMRPFIPYCLHKINEDNYLPLNRDYKPLGMPRGTHYDYEKFHFLFLKPSEINLDILWDNGFGFGGYGYYFYSDSCTPCSNFSRYIEILNISIFLEKSDKKFQHFWKYKFNLDNDGWKRNEWKTVETRNL